MNKLPLIFYLALWPLLLFGQKKETIRLDYKPDEKIITPDEDKINLRRNAYFNFEIRKVNSAVYKPVFEVDTRAFKEEGPEILKTLIPQVTAFSNALNDGEEANSLSKNDVDDILINLRQSSRNALLYLERVKTEATDLYDSIIPLAKGYTINDQQKEAKSILDNFLTEIHIQTEQQIGSLKSQSNKLQTEIDSASSKLTRLQEQKMIVQEKIDNLDSLTKQNVSSQEDTNNNNGKSLKDQLTEVQQEISKILNRVKLLKQEITRGRKELKKLDFLIIESQDFARELKKDNGDVKDSKHYQNLLKAYVEAQLVVIEQVDKIVLKMMEAPTMLGRLGTEVYVAYQEVNRNQQLADRSKVKYRRAINFLIESLNAKESVSTKRFEARQDVVVFDMKLVNKISGDTIVKKKLEYYTFGGFSFNFSTGFFGNCLTETAYYLETKDTIHKFVKPEKKRSFDIAIGALLHTSLSVSPRFQAGLVIGAALSPLDKKVRYLGGFSALFGKKKLFSLSAGICMANLKVLSGQVSRDTETGELVVPAALTEVPTYEQLERGFFIGLSYNLSRK